MDKEEKEKTRLLLKQMAREEENINQVLINTYYEAIKDIPLDRETILQKQSEDRIFEDLTVISASKNGNNILLMDKNRSFYELPRDKVLEGYNKQQEKQHKAEMKHRRSNRVDVGWER